MSSFLRPWSQSGPVSSPPSSPYTQAKFSPTSSSPRWPDSCTPSKPPSKYSSLLTRPMSSPTRSRDARRQAYRDHMRSVRQNQVMKARGGDDRMINDILIGEHKQWLEAQQREGSKFTITPEEAEALFEEFYSSEFQSQKTPSISLIKQQSDSTKQDQILLEEFLEQQEAETNMIDHSIDYYLQFENQDQDVEMAD